MRRWLFNHLATYPLVDGWLEERRILMVTYEAWLRELDSEEAR